ncbi:hypothetical protein M0R72_19610 [Candidatus Pacearchaeota archaeon]|jgi:hypothetical protein|nr:hypothetical protein [Candidatus Pacearchaeota archaeon]
MIEPPMTDIIDLLDSCGFVAKAAYLRDAAEELEALRAITKELAASDGRYDNGICVFCGSERRYVQYGGEYRIENDWHEADCLVERAKELMKA